jgi:hypothetical protein
MGQAGDLTAVVRGWTPAPLMTGGTAQATDRDREY